MTVVVLNVAEIPVNTNGKNMNLLILHLLVDFGLLRKVGTHFVEGPQMDL